MDSQMDSPILTETDVPLPGFPSFPWRGGIERQLARMEMGMITRALADAGGVKRRACTLLGISRYALERRITRAKAALEPPAPLIPRSAPLGSGQQAPGPAKLRQAGGRP